MIIKSEQDYINIKESSLIVGKTLGEVAQNIRPGITSKMLDLIAEECIRSNDAVPAFKGYRGYPATLCISINDVVVHGIPNNTIIKEGDIVSVDCGAIKNSMFADYAYTFAVGELTDIKYKLIEVTYKSLMKGISNALTGNSVGDIGNAVQEYVENNGFSVVRELVGHGIGKILHDKPEVPNYGKKGKGYNLKKDLTICIEPMINMGRKEIYQDRDGWTIKTLDRLPSAHFEHMVIVKDQTPEVLSTYEFVEKDIKNNIWLSNRQ